MSSNPPPNKPAPLPPDPGFLDTCYDTIFICMMLIILTSVPFFAQYWERFQEPDLKHTLYVIAALLFVICLVCWLFRAPMVHLGSWKWSMPIMVRQGALPLIVSLSIVGISLMCYASGGAHDSPFKHYLLSVTSIAVILARENWTRLVFGIVTVLAYIITLNVYLAPSNPIQNGWIDCLCLAVSVFVAIVAGFKQSGVPVTGP